MTSIRVFAGERLDQPDDEDTIDVDADDEAACMQSAIDWSAGRWPESDHGYTGVVWARSHSGALIGSQEIDITSDGEIDA